ARKTPVLPGRLKTGPTSILRHTWIDPVRPRQDPALQVLELTEALGLKELHRLGAAHPALAMNDDLAVGVQRAEALGQLRQGQQGAAGNAANLELGRIAHIENEQGLAAVQPAFQLLHRGLPGVRGYRRSCRFLATDAAELLIIDQLGDGRLVAADRASRIAADLELTEAHLQRIIKHQPADQRLALAEDQLDRFSRLDAADETRKDAQHPTLSTARHFPRRRRLRIEAA